MRERRPIDQAQDVIQLASRVCNFNLGKEFGVSQAIVETLDTTYALAVGAGARAAVPTSSAPALRERRCAALLSTLWVFSAHTWSGEKANTL